MTGSTSWEDPTTKHTYILIFHKSFYYEKKLNHSLINPKQVCYNDTKYWIKPKNQNGLSIIIDGGSKISLHLNGTKIKFHIRSTTKHELENCTHIDMSLKSE